MKTEAKRKRGRPVNPDSLRQGGVRIGVRILDPEREACEAAAGRVGLTLSEWVRQTIVRAANRQTKS